MSKWVLCESCPHQVICHSSSWNEGGNPSDPPPLDNLTFVHSCKSCFEPVLSAWKNNDTRLLVPEGCPRWHPRAGSALDCGDCEKARDSLRTSDPRWAEGLVSSGNLINFFMKSLKSRKEHGDNYVDLQLEVGKKTVLNSLVEQTSTAIPVLKALSGGPESEEYKEAADLLDRLLLVVWDDPIFSKEREDCKNDCDINDHIMDWVYWLRISIKLSEESTKLTERWKLIFTERPIASRTWVKWPISRRKLILRMWEGIIRGRYGIQA